VMFDNNVLGMIMDNWIFWQFKNTLFIHQ
jgi:hypothetical protein